MIVGICGSPRQGATEYVLKEALKSIKNMGFETNNTLRMTLTNDGKFGIGTTTPNSLLEVAGLIHSTSGGIKF